VSLALALLLAALPRVLTLEEALRLFRENGFDLLIAEAQVAGAQGDAEAGAAVANPQLSGTVGKSFGYDPSACAGCSAIAWSVGISDPSALSDLISGKRGLRVDVGRAALAAARHSREEALRTLSLQVRQAMLDGALVQAQRDVIRELAGSSERTRALNEKRLRAGAISEAELARAEVAALEADQAVALAEQALRAARLQIAFLLGSRENEEEFTIDPDLLDRPLPASEALPRDSFEHRPDLLAAAAQEARAEATLSLEQRRRIPDVALSAQYAQQGTGQNALQPPTFTVGTQLDLPLFYRRSGEIVRAEADRRAQRIAYEKLRAQARAEVETARASVETNRSLVERMRGRLLGRAQRMRDLAQVQYEKGASSLLELLDAQRTWAQTRSEYLKDLHDFWLSLFQLDAALGRT
jgi:cobalt-zinc-cadmium efflux system outer membrane protein